MQFIELYTSIRNYLINLFICPTYHNITGPVLYRHIQHDDIAWCVRSARPIYNINHIDKLYDNIHRHHDDIPTREQFHILANIVEQHYDITIINIHQLYLLIGHTCPAPIISKSYIDTIWAQTAIDILRLDHTILDADHIMEIFYNWHRVHSQLII